MKARTEQAREILRQCHLCPRECRVDRLSGQKGKCQVTRQVVVSSYGPHFGEEAPLVGLYGSGTIFFAYCNLKCAFCQNYTISHLGEGTEVTGDELAIMMLSLQGQGCHNINLVSPTHVVPHILQALDIAVRQGLSIPLVYNTGGYDSLETLRLLDRIVDIYMPDMKYSDARAAERLSGIKDYPRANQTAVREMHRQVGDLEMDKRGIAQRGLLVRHLVLPNQLAGTEEVVRFLAQEISADTYLNIMAQYHPCHQALDLPQLSRRITDKEFSEAVDLAHQYGLNRLDRHASSPLARLILR